MQKVPGQKAGSGLYLQWSDHHLQHHMCSSRSKAQDLPQLPRGMTEQPPLPPCLGRKASHTSAQPRRWKKGLPACRLAPEVRMSAGQKEGGEMALRSLPSMQLISTSCVRVLWKENDKMRGQRGERVKKKTNQKEAFSLGTSLTHSRSSLNFALFIFRVEILLALFLLSAKILNLIASRLLWPRKSEIIPQPISTSLLKSNKLRRAPFPVSSLSTCTKKYRCF